MNAKTIIVTWLLFIIPSYSYASDIIKINASDEINERVKYAWEISKEDKAFIWMIEAENSQWSTYRKSIKWYYKKWKKYYDIWICQFSQYYQKKVVNDKNFLDWKWQINKCYELYKWWTTFYWLKKWKQTIKRFEIK